MLEPLSCSPDVTPCDFYFPIPNLMGVIKRTLYEDLDDVLIAVMTELEVSFQECFKGVTDKAGKVQ